MKDDLFVLNERFVVYKSSNEVHDKESGQKKHVEPRLIRLLCLLADSEGKLLSRQYIIKEIWDDYPGANEGLNQAISFLRKLLGDEKKDIIQTIPKKGYILRALISQYSPQEPVRSRHLGRPMTLLAGMLLILLLMPAWYSFYKNGETTNISDVNADKGKALRPSKIVSTYIPTKKRLLNPGQTAQIDDGNYRIKDLGELGRLDMKGDSSKFHHLDGE